MLRSSVFILLLVNLSYQSLYSFDCVNIFLNIVQKIGVSGPPTPEPEVAFYNSHAHKQEAIDDLLGQWLRHSDIDWSHFKSDRHDRLPHKVRSLKHLGSLVANHVLWHSRAQLRQIRDQMAESHMRLSPQVFVERFTESIQLSLYATYRILNVVEQKTSFKVVLGNAKISLGLRFLTFLTYASVFPFFDNITYYPLLSDRDRNNPKPPQKRTPFEGVLWHPSLLYSPFEFFSTWIPESFVYKSIVLSNWFLEKYKYGYFIPVVMFGSLFASGMDLVHLGQTHQSILNVFVGSDPAHDYRPAQAFGESFEDETVTDHYEAQISVIAEKIRVHGDPDGSLNQKKQVLILKMEYLK